VTAYLVGLTVQVSVVTGAALLAAWILRRRSAALRHWVLAVAVACAACLPVFQVVAPTWAVAVVPGVGAGGGAPAADAPGRLDARGGASPRGPIAASQTTEPRSEAGVSVTRALAAAWAAGTCIALTALTVGLLRLALISRRARPLTHPAWTRLAAETARNLGIRREVSLLHSDHPAFLAAWGWIRPRVVLPRSAPEWPEEIARIVLGHELAHIARGDWLVQLAAEVVRAVNWLNPIVWFSARRLRAESERACDDLVLVQGVAGSEYAERLIALARSLGVHQRRYPALPALPMARPSTLERRVVAMLDARINRAPVSRRAQFAIAVLALAFALPIAGLTASAQGPGFGGTVFDPTSRAVPNVTVSVKNTQTQELREVRTDAQGRFEFASLPPGPYTFEARLPGFMTIKGTVDVTSPGLQRDLNLKVGSLMEVVVITAGPGTAARPSTPAAAPRAIPPRPPCTASAAGGQITPPRKLRDQKPDYPAHLAAAGVSGPVEIEGEVGPDGRVVNVRVVTTAHEDLSRSLIDAVGGWVFGPTLLNCDPIGVKITVKASFTLR
jgi:beta-lactamase regulating signal transducer with metallopeptidase domain